MIGKTLPSLIAGIITAVIGSTAVAATDTPAAPTTGMSGSPRGTVKGGSDYEQTMKQAGMSGMSGMSGMDNSMVAKKPATKTKKKAAHKKTHKKAKKAATQG